MNDNINENSRVSFVFYESFYSAINVMEITEQLTIYKAIAEYSLYRQEPNLTGVGGVVWLLIKPQLDANWRRFESGCRGGKHGSKGGAPEGNVNARREGDQSQNNPKTTPKQPQNNPKTTPNVNVNVNVNDNVNDNINVESTKKERTAKRFTPPTTEQVDDYLTQKSYTASAQSFIDYYQSNGWMVGRSPMRDWRAALRRWCSKEQQEGQQAEAIQTTLQTQQQRRYQTKHLINGQRFNPTQQVAYYDDI
ncbi:MAG: DUF6291 domain-containing protein [Rikenellaceae bacterium]